jgi:hypothetical protein
MTDQDQQTEQQTALSIADQTQAISVEMSSAVATINANLDYLRDAPDVEQRAEIVAHTQQWVAYLDSLHAQAVTALGATAEIAVQTQQQRDEAVEALEELTKAVDNADYNHPLVSSLIEAVEQNAYEYMSEQYHEDDSESYDEGYSSGYEDGLSATGNDYSSLYAEIATHSNVTPDDAERFVDVLKG